MQTSSGMYIASSITREKMRVMLKAIRTGVGFGSGTETNASPDILGLGMRLLPLQTFLAY